MHSKEYLIKRGSRYHFRLKIPVHLRHLIGRIEIRRTLGTSDYQLARMYAQRLAWITLKLFDVMSKTDTKISLTTQQIRDHLDHWYDQMLERDLEISKLIEQGVNLQPPVQNSQLTSLL